MQNIKLDIFVNLLFLFFSFLCGSYFQIKHSRIQDTDDLKPVKCILAPQLVALAAIRFKKMVVVVDSFSLLPQLCL